MSPITGNSAGAKYRYNGKKSRIAVPGTRLPAYRNGQIALRAFGSCTGRFRGSFGYAVDGYAEALLHGAFTAACPR